MENKQLRDVLILVAFLVSIPLISSLHSVITPFFLAAFIAYLIDPVIHFFISKTRLSHLWGTIIVYLVFISLLTFTATRITILLARELRELSLESVQLDKYIWQQTGLIPQWSRLLVREFNSNFDLGALFSPGRLWPYFSGAISGLAALLIFFVATFYFLKDGHVFSENILQFIPLKKIQDRDRLSKEINRTLNDYLRGQVFLVILMTTVTWLVLAIIGVKYALLLAIFTGIAEIIPYIGPLTAGTIATLVAIFDNTNRLGVPPLLEGAFVALVYLLLRQIEDLFVIPNVLGKVTKLHPLLVLFLVLLGGHLWGVFGMVLAVPMAAVIRTLLVFFNRK